MAFVVKSDCRIYTRSIRDVVYEIHNNGRIVLVYIIEQFLCDMYR